MAQPPPPGPHQALFDSIPQTGLKCDILFVVIRNRIAEEPDYVRKLRVVFQFNILRHGQHACTWTCDTRGSLQGDVYRSAPRAALKPDCVLTVDDDDWLRIMLGKLNPQRAFIMSKFKIKGNIMLLQKLHSVWFELRRRGRAPELDLIHELMLDGPLLAGLKGEAVAVELVQRVVRRPTSAVAADIRLDVEQGGQLRAHYLLGLRASGPPVFKRALAGASHEAAQPPPADLSLALDDDDLVLIVYGVCKVAQAIETGRLRVRGRPELLELATAILEQPAIMARL